MAKQLPTGVATFLFTDIEGSTRLLRRVGDDFGPLLDEHHSVIRQATAWFGGIEVHTEGDAFFIVFTEASAAVAAAVAAQRALRASLVLDAAGVRVRMGLHVGEAKRGGDNYVGIDVHVAARVSAAAHGGQILVTDDVVEAVGDGLAPGVYFEELDEYWLKDLPDPLRLSRLRAPDIADGFPPVAAASTRPHNAPFALSTFVGRADEIERTVEALVQSRLVTLTGPGGTGKTRLAVQVGSAMTREFDDGVFFVPLAGITDEREVPSAVLDGLEAPGADPGLSPAEHLGRYLSHRQTLLIVDNCEQVLAAAPMLGTVLEAAHATTILATSRSPLRLDGERELRVPPLQVPLDEPDRSPEALLTSSAVQLFADRARSVSDGFTINEDNAEPVRAIVSRLDGLPLAIELAAVRVRMLTPEAILQTLDPLSLTSRRADGAVHQRALRDTIQWSVDLLPEPERDLFTRLAVFIGGADIMQIDPVCRPAELGLDLIDGLGGLVEQSLLVGEPGGAARFHMLETIREYGLQQLAEAPHGDSIRDRHLDAFVRLAEDASPHLEGTGAATWMNRLSLDNSNLQAAMARAIETRHAEHAQRIVGALWRYWQVRGHLEEAAELATSALALEGAPHQVRARALDAAGSIAYWRGDGLATRQCYEEALEAHRSVGDRAGIANALYNLSFPVGDQDGYDAGRVLLDEASTLFEEQGDLRGRTRANVALARSWLTESPQRSTEHSKEAIRSGEELGDPVELAWANSIYGNGLLLLHEHQQAAEAFQTALTTFEDVGDLAGIAIELAAIADTARAAGDTSTALHLAGGVTELWKDTGAGIVTPLDESIAGFVSPENLAMLSPRLQETFELGRNESLHDLVEAALAYSTRK